MPSELPKGTAFATLIFLNGPLQRLSLMISDVGFVIMRLEI